MIPRCSAIVTACVRSLAPNLERTLEMWFLTVVSPMQSLSAICLLALPAPIKRSTSISRDVSSIDGQLSAKGLTKVSPGEDPDVLVSYDVVFDQDIRGMGFRDGLRNLRLRSGSKYVLMGMLVVNLVDSGTGSMVWRGMASGDVDANASPKKHDKKIHEVVQKIFRSYPPKE